MFSFNNLHLKQQFDNKIFHLYKKSYDYFKCYVHVQYLHLKQQFDTKIFHLYKKRYDYFKCYVHVQYLHLKQQFDTKTSNIRVPKTTISS